MDKIKSHIVSELHAPARRFFKRRKVVLKCIDDLWQADLVDLQVYKKFNKGYRYLLIIIDCFSKFAWAEPLKTKTGVEVTEAVNKIINAYPKRKPNFLQTDLGKEFYNHNWRNLMERENIHHYSTYSTMKACIAERFIRTLKCLIFREFNLRGNYKWIEFYQKILYNYNNKVHSTIKMKPREVKGKEVEKKLLGSVYRIKKTILLPKFKLGDYVRVSKQRSVFSKSYLASWTTEMFTVYKIRMSDPIVYYLKDSQGKLVKGCFYKEELQKVKYPDHYLVEKVIKKKGNRCYVKWLGFDDSFNSWINLTDAKLL